MSQEYGDEHVGGAGGASSEAGSESDSATPENGGVSPGSGQIEIPLGTPVTDEELERLKELARRPDPRRGATDSRSDSAGSAQRDEPQE